MIDPSSYPETHSRNKVKMLLEFSLFSCLCVRWFIAWYVSILSSPASTTFIFIAGYPSYDWIYCRRHVLGIARKGYRGEACRRCLSYFFAEKDDYLIFLFLLYWTLSQSPSLSEGWLSWDVSSRSPNALLIFTHLSIICMYACSSLQVT